MYVCVCVYVKTANDLNTKQKTLSIVTSIQSSPQKSPKEFNRIVMCVVQIQVVIKSPFKPGLTILIYQKKKK